MSKNRIGFTLMELVIVLGMLGILMSMLLIALNPFEQLNRARDVSNKIALRSIYDSVNRFRVKNGYMPWCESVDVLTCEDIDPPVTLKSSSVEIIAHNLIEAGETSVDFRENLQDASLSEIFLYSPFTQDMLSMCYQPHSRAFKSDDLNKYVNATGLLGNETECPPNDPSSNCYSCLIIR